MIDITELNITEMKSEEATQIQKWTYQEPYSICNWDSSKECLAELLNGTYYSAVNSESHLIGYFCFGRSAQVPAGDQHGMYRNNDYTDIGLGVRPDLCGKGLGLRFLEKGLSFARNKLSAVKFRLTVAEFNQRAINVYEKAGFNKEARFERVSSNGITVFYVMTQR